MIKIGKYVNTHGIKGEIRILSDFSRKDLVFIPNKKIYINNIEFSIKTYRKHKQFDMITLDGINNINDILFLKGKDVFVKKEDINEFTLEDLYDYDLVINENKYKLKEILNNNKQKLLLLTNDKMIPFVPSFIDKIDEENKILYMTVLEELL